ncbi:MAG: SRPBCC family protein [Acidimicrobiales bacterium]|nr:SRPBCC family protein [Acidimicrobiales bacterium]
MKKLWKYREIDAPADDLWRLLTNPQEWPAWGPSVRSATVHGDSLERGAKGRVTTVGGLELEFEITDFEEGEFWAWKVAGVPATHHTVESLGPNQCRVGFGVPLIAAPYLAICEVALRRLDTMSEQKTANR